VRRIWTIVGVGLLVGTLLEIPALEPGRAHGSASATSGSSPGHNVFRPYGSPDGLRDELEQLAARNPDITKLVTIGRTVRGEYIVALKVSRQARRIRDGRRPATLYLGGQHGREWIPPEMVRRLAHHVVDGYRIDPALTDGFLLPLHPFLSHYLSPGRPCKATGTTGSWNAFTGESGGWVDAAFDLSPYAGGSVDVKVSYITDAVDVGVGGGIGVFVDDTRLTVNGAAVEADGFEADGGAWAVVGPPAGSPPPVHGNFAIARELIPVAASVATKDTALLGFGIESLRTPAARAEVLGRVLERLRRPSET
jgi:hypothetical protein